MLHSEPPEYTITPITHVDNPVTFPGDPSSLKIVTSPFLQSVGFGWLVETDREHERMFDRPLIEELDIDLAEIWYKIRCVLLPLPQVLIHNSFCW
jgi:hypothetical protein